MSYIYIYMEFGVNEILEVITIVIAMSRPLFSMLKTTRKKKKNEILDSS